nr:hypothetical protein [Tanacetum cinerariifolium]
MLQIYPRLPGQNFEDPLFKEEIHSFIRNLGHTREIKVLTDVNVNYMYQPWRSFAAIINRCLSGKTTGLDSLCLSHYKEYYVVASGAEPSKEKIKYKKKADEPVTSSKSKTAPASKGSKLKSSAKVAKIAKKKQPATMPKTKGLVVLSEVALSKAEKIKLATKRSKKDFHMSYASGLGNGVDTQSKIPDKQQKKVTGTDEGAGDRPEVLDVPKYNLEIEEESWTFSQDDEDANEETDMNDDTNDKEEEEEKADDDEVSSDQRMYTPPDYQLTDEEENQEGDDKVKEANQVTKDTHVTLTTVPLVVQQQSSFVWSDLVSKFINPSPDIENEMSEFKQTNQFAEAISSITGIVDNYLASKMKDAVDVLLWNSSGDSGPELCFEKSASLKRLFSLAHVSLAKASKPVLSLDVLKETIPHHDLVKTYRIPLDLHPRLPDPGFTMVRLPADAIGDLFSFSKRHNTKEVCMDDGPSSLRKWKDKFFLIDHRAITDYLTWRHSYSCVLNDLPSNGYDRNDVQRLCARLICLCEMREEVLVRSGLSSVWFNKECDPVFRRIHDNAGSIYDFMTLPSRSDAKIVEESYHLSFPLLDPVSSHTTVLASEGAIILLPTPDEIAALTGDFSTLLTLRFFKQYKNMPFK